MRNFQKYADLMEKENEINNTNNNDVMDTDQNNKNAFKLSKKLEKEKLIKKKFCEFGSKTISSLMTGINSDQIQLNNKLFKIIDKTNKKVKKEKQLDKVLEIHESGRMKRMEAERELESIEKELKEKLIEIKVPNDN